MEHLKVIWVHNHHDEPVIMYYEYSGDREIRKIEVYPDGTVGYASDTESVNGSFISGEAFPSFEQIATQPEFHPFKISREQFDELWKLARNKGLS